jgi:AcrR family transcriptional regulator
MARNADDTRRRIMQAATDEFATYGIAGARMDRVARDADSSKERIYAYFGNKEALFEAVFTNSVKASMDAVDFDATDLPAYAGRMFDYFADNPNDQRLSIWYRLERPAGTGLKAVVEANQVRLTALADAQHSGRLAAEFTPVQLLTLIQAMATSWGTMNPEFASSAKRVSRRERRRTVVEAVTRITQSDSA